MAFITWNESLSVGVPLVDDDHKILIELINQLEDGVGDNEETAVLGTVLDALIDYTVYHFAREEKVMEACGFPEMNDHVGEHRDLTSRVRGIQRRFRDGDHDALGKETLDFLKDWLTHHILKSDMAYRRFAEDNEAAVEAAEQVPRLRPDKGQEVDEDQKAVGAFDWSRLNALIIDDNPNFRRVARTILDSVRSNSVWEAVNGAEGLEILKDFDVDVVLCDWRMSGMDGIEFVSRLRAQGNTVPVIMMSGYGDEAFAERARAAGVDNFLEKPITARSVLVSIAKAVPSGRKG